MGAGQSIPSTLTRQKVFDLTRNTRATMDVLLDYMLKELTVRDFLALSNPSECKKYVIFLANTLYKHFYELQIEPTKDKKGIIAFRPVKELITPSKQDDSEKQTLCLTLAYFYTRIFQIYGALALTVLDDAKFMTESGFLPTTTDSIAKTLQPPGYRTFVTSGGNMLLKGGAISSQTLGKFNFLKPYLIDDKNDRNRFGTKYESKGETVGTVRFLPRVKMTTSTGVEIQTADEKRQKGVFYIAYKGATEYAELETIAAELSIEADTIKVTFENFSYKRKDGTTHIITLPSDILPQKILNISIKRPSTEERDVAIKSGIFGTIKYSIKGSSEPISNFYNNMFAKIIPYLKHLVENNNTSYTASSGIIISETGTTEELRLAKIVQNLTRIKPMGHCLARAMQLLKTYPIPNSDSVSYICKAKFFEHSVTTSDGTKIEASRSGIPQPGAPIDTSPGLAALSLLFYDTVLASTPKIIIGNKPYGPDKKSSEQRYVEFMKKMGTFFGDQKIDSQSITKETLKSGLSGIKNKRDTEICRGLPDTLTVPKNDVKNVYQIVNQLFQIQVRHAAECGKIIKLLFDINRDKSSGLYKISLSNNIIKKGFSEIERINYLTRDVLVKYYENCELTYLNGVKIVMSTSPEAIAARQKTQTPTPS